MADLMKSSEGKWKQKTFRQQTILWLDYFLLYKIMNKTEILEEENNNPEERENNYC